MVIYIDPENYAGLAVQSAKYDIARAVGEINKYIGSKDEHSVMLLGPGRWGTTIPSLGVPVSFSEINNMSILGEIAFADSNSAPEISFGTHFFQDLIETDIFYLALTSKTQGTYLNRKILCLAPNMLKKIAPQYDKYCNIIKVLDVQGRDLRLVADIVSQKIMCYFKGK
jgi:hypothetical protein